MSSGYLSAEVTNVWLRILVGRSPRRTAIRAGLLVLASIIIVKWVLVPVRIQGPSMEPTYHDGSVNFINRLAYVRKAPERGDVVGFRYGGIRIMLLKRIIGLPGERMMIRNGQVFINGEPLSEPYLTIPPARWNEPEELIAEDEYFIIGDNRSTDQRGHEHGIVQDYRIVGKVLF